jgi:hypothetical protein
VQPDGHHRLLLPGKEGLGLSAIGVARLRGIWAGDLMAHSNPAIPWLHLMEIHEPSRS